MTGGPRVVLVGPPGAGTTAVAEALGRTLGKPVRDSDRDVEAATGMTVGQLFLDAGEATFREHERAAVLAALAGFTGVLAVGGGAVLDPAVEQALHGHPVVFLDVGIADAARRLGFNTERPAGLAHPRALWLRQMEHRRPVYRRVAAVTVDTDGKTPGQVAREVLDALGAAPAAARRDGDDADLGEDGDG